MAFDPFARLEDDDANDGGYERQALLAPDPLRLSLITWPPPLCYSARRGTSAV